MPTRQIAFFLVAIASPCALLVVLTLRMLVQDGELADKRIADERRRIAVDVRQALLARVESLRILALATSDAAAPELPADVALVARVEAGRVVLPWETAVLMASRTPDDPRVREMIRAGEQREFIARQFNDAATAYQRAADVARHPLHRASAQLLAARALVKAGREGEARQIATAILRLQADVVDDQAIPLVVYAARLLSDRRHAVVEDAQPILEHLRRVVSSRAIGPAALYMARDVTRQLMPTVPALEPQIAEIGRLVDQRARDIEQSLEFRSDFSTLGLPAARVAGEPLWISYGPNAATWLVTLSPATDVPVVVAIRAEPVLTAVGTGFGVAVGSSAQGEPLTPTFPGLTASLPPQALAKLSAETRRQRPFYLAALALVVSVALVGTYLFWRDVRREARLAEMRSQFVASVSHELKTPLTAIRMFAETLLMRRSTPADVQQEYLETIVNESERLTRLLNNVLDFSNIESGTKAYRLEPHSLADAVRAAAKAIHYPFAQQGFQLHVAIDEEVPAVAADPDAIEQAVLNLLSNAMKYSGDARAVDLQLTQHGDRAVIRVTDHGIGIPVAEQSRIFDKFYRVRDAGTERIAGTGLGLTLVDHVARGHGGTVVVQSAPGQGSTFALELPLLPATAAVPSTTALIVGRGE